jgi:hypothetical protein
VITFVLAATLCGVSFSLPKGWNAEVVRPDGADTRCEIELTPPRWDDINNASLWGAWDSPARLFLFKSSSIDAAMPDAGFEKEEERGWTFPARGRNASTESFHIGTWLGVRAEGWYRGYAVDTSKVPPDESSVYTVATFGVVLKKGRRVTGMMCESGPPSYRLDCDALISRVFKSLRYARNDR